MRSIALFVVLAILLVGAFAVQAQVASVHAPTWEIGDSWQYKARVAFDPRKTSVTDFTIFVTRSSVIMGLPVDFVFHRGRTYTYPPEILLVEWDADAVERLRVISRLPADQQLVELTKSNFVAVYDRLSLLSWWEVALVEEDGNKKLATDKEGPLRASIDGWRLFDWPLSVGKRWVGTSMVTVQANDVIRTDYEARVSDPSAVKVPAGTFEALEVKYSGRISRQGKTMPFEQTVWFSPVAKNVVRLVLSAAGRNIELELIRHWRRGQ